MDTTLLEPVWSRVYEHLSFEFCYDAARIGEAAADVDTVFFCLHTTMKKTGRNMKYRPLPTRWGPNLIAQATESTLLSRPEQNLSYCCFTAPNQPRRVSLMVPPGASRYTPVCLEPRTHQLRNYSQHFFFQIFSDPEFPVVLL